VTYLSANYIREVFKSLLENEDYVIDKTGVKMIEIVGANFIADMPTIFGKPNEDYIRREIEWYESMSLNVNDIEAPVPEIWQQVASEKGEINSNYGWCIWSDANHAQYENAVDELRNNPHSRRAVMIYTRPSMWNEYNRDGMSDFMCTNTVQYLIRHERLHAVVQMRSNDAVFGYKNDYAWQKHVLDMMSDDLAYEPGDIHWNVGSLHVYQRHFDLVK
jgi:thymidylate synthase